MESDGHYFMLPQIFDGLSHIIVIKMLYFELFVIINTCVLSCYSLSTVSASKSIQGLAWITETLVLYGTGSLQDGIRAHVDCRT